MVDRWLEGHLSCHIAICPVRAMKHKSGIWTLGALWGTQAGTEQCDQWKTSGVQCGVCSGSTVCVSVEGGQCIPGVAL